MSIQFANFFVLKVCILSYNRFVGGDIDGHKQRNW
nr:MAG TPA: hypothetical protein [Caudoviricetes sp.]